MRISLSESAINDLEDIKDHYKEEGVPHIGINFVSSIIKHIETLPDNPEIGRMVPEFNSPKIRELIHSPFRIVYIKEGERIRVVRVWRSERLLKLSDSSNDSKI